MIRDFLASAVEQTKANFGIALIIVAEVDAATVGGPLRILDVAVEFVVQGVRAGAIAVHEIELGGLVALIAIVVTGVSDEFSVGRNGRRIVRSFAVRERAQGTVGDTKFVDFIVAVFVIRLGVAIDGNDQVLAIGGPGGARGAAEFVAAVGEIAVGDLPWRATLGVDDKNLHVAGLQVPRAIEAIDEAVVGGGRIGPLCARRRNGKISEMGTLSEDKRGEGEHLSIGRPGDGVGRLIEIGDPCGLAGVHPADVELLLAVGIGKIGNACAIGRPARRHVGAISSGEGTMIRSVGVDGPEI